MAARLKRAALICTAAILTPIALVHVVLRASLAQLEGTLEVAGIGATVSIERDALGVATVRGTSRADVAYATGFVHAQDRFFQMDLSRRLAAGELSELFGAAALEQDKRARIFRFRHVATQVLAHAPAEQRALVAAYARGVNAGLASLRSRPWEYWALRAKPSAWREEDTILVAHSMWWDLQYSELERERLRHTINARLGGPQCESGWKCSLHFLYPGRTSWDAPNVAGEPERLESGGSGTDVLEVPSPAELDVRRLVQTVRAIREHERIPAAGSNNWAIAGRLTASGAALVANDMHLRLRVPPVWYRVRLRVPAKAGERAIDITGVTLPGVPAVVAGSNGRVAWGFTNSYGDWLDLRPVACTRIGDSRLRTPQGIVRLSVVRERIRVRGATDVIVPVRSGRSGVLLDSDPAAGHCWFASWLAQLPAATNLHVLSLERATSVAEVLALAPDIGIPHQNLIVGDRRGHIAWTVLGRIPEHAADGRTDGRSAWRSAAHHPRLLDPPIGRLWSANALATEDPRYQEAIGGDESALGAGYDLGARARQIRDALLRLDDRAVPADMLRIQLDHRAVFLARWQALLMELLDASALRDRSRRQEFRHLVAAWDGHAAADSAAYRLVRAYRERTEAAVWQMILQALRLDTDAPPPERFEAALWKLISEQPLHMLAAEYSGWREFLLAQVDATIARLDASCGALAQCTWGARSPVRVRHPLSSAVPLLSPLIDMPTVLLAGDHDMPRVQDGAFGASERFAVSPGHENEGYLHIAGGQSGHPLSPYYRAGFRDWARGRPLPFLPGPRKHRLTLQPE